MLALFTKLVEVEESFDVQFGTIGNVEDGSDCVVNGVLLMVVVSFGDTSLKPEHVIGGKDVLGVTLMEL